MARMTNTGIDELIDEMKRLGEAADGVQEEMLAAGVEIVREKWRESAERHGHRNTGAMIEAIGPSPIRRDGSAITAAIYPQGKDKKGKRNAEKAYILNYGTSRIDASHWVEEAERAAEGPLLDTYERIWDEYLKTQGG